MNKNKIINISFLISLLFAFNSSFAQSGGAINSQPSSYDTPGTIVPECKNSSSDPDGDGWGWENMQSCHVGGSFTRAENTVCKSSSSDHDGDGWGWENGNSCVVQSNSTASNLDETSSNQNVTNEETQLTTSPTCSSANSDSDGDGWGWENGDTCIVESSPETSFASTTSSSPEINTDEPEQQVSTPEPVFEGPELPNNPSDREILDYASTMRSKLLASPDRIGYGADTTGGRNPVIARNWDDILSATRDAGNYVIIAPDARMPMIANRSISIKSPNITIDGSLVPGGPVIEIQDSSNPTYALIIDGGNFILHNMKFMSESQGSEEAVLRIRRGENYWIDHFEVEGYFKDDALSLGQRNSGSNQATNITISNYKVTNSGKGILVSGLIRSDRTIYYTVHKSYLNAKDRNPRSNSAVGHIFNTYISSGPSGSGGSGITSILAGTANDGVFRGVVLSESNVFELGNNNKGDPKRSQFTCTAGSDVGDMLELSDGTEHGYINTDNLSIFSGYENRTDAATYRACSENFNHSKASFRVPYSYQKIPTSEVFDYVNRNAGVQ